MSKVSLKVMLNNLKKEVKFINNTYYTKKEINNYYILLGEILNKLPNKSSYDYHRECIYRIFLILIEL